MKKDVMANSKLDPNSDILDSVEEHFVASLQSDGYREGFDAGKKAGVEDGYALGAAEGAKKGAELGYLQGYTFTYKTLLFKDSNTSAPKSEKAMNEVIQLIDEFPRTNETKCEEKLANIRIKFRQAFVNLSQQTSCLNN